MSRLATIFNTRAIGKAGLIGCGVIGAASLLNSVWIGLDSGTPQPVLAFNSLYLLAISAAGLRALRRQARPDANTPS